MRVVLVLLIIIAGISVCNLEFDRVPVIAEAQTVTVTASLTKITTQTVTSANDSTTVTANYQFNLLTILAQEAIAHGAVVFATLTAVFTFATGFASRLKETDNNPSYRRAIFAYGFFLTVLFWEQCMRFVD